VPTVIKKRVKPRGNAVVVFAEIDIDSANTFTAVTPASLGLSEIYFIQAFAAITSGVNQGLYAYRRSGSTHLIDHGGFVNGGGGVGALVPAVGSAMGISVLNIMAIGR
jgi:hypothetical protein